MIIDLHTVTFDELLKSEHPVCCFRGKMWGGPARRGYNAIHPTELWKAWQMEISLALRNQHPQHRWTDVPQPVIDYYQRTKAFTKPPTEEQIRAYKEPVMTKNHLTPPKIKQQKNFSWSYTALNDFETCPFAYAEKRVYKTVPYVQSEEAKWGELVHLTAENYLNNRKQSQQAFVDQETLPLVKPYCDALVKAATGGTLLTEFEMAIDRKMQICGSREWNRAWGRGIADVVIIKGDTAWVYDWKGLALDTELPTPGGWTTMGGLNVGDKVYGADGNACNVIAKSQVHNRDCYKITFCDGTTVIADNEHLWSVVVGKKTKYSKTEVLSTETLFSKNDVVSPRITIAKPLQARKKELAIDPYVLGVWLGDGKHTSGEICKPDDELFDLVRQQGYDVGNDISSNDRCQTRTIYKLRTQLRKEGLLGNKHIPQHYMRAAYEQRLALLQGICDTDGYFNPTRRQVIVTTIDHSFAENVCELINSLGTRARVYKVAKRGFGKELWGYDIVFTPYNFNPFRLTRKAVNVNTVAKYIKNDVWRIKKIEKVDSVPTQCIAVDSPDNLYLCTRSMVPTHNTGKVKDDPTQLKLFCAFLALHYPQIQHFLSKFIWLKTKTTTGMDKPITKAEILEVWKDILVRVRRMEEAWVNEVFPMKKNGLCRKYCPIFSCPHCGK